MARIALEIADDYIILDGRGGGKGVVPLIFRENISVPTIPALAKANWPLDKRGQGNVTLIITAFSARSLTLPKY